MLTTHLDEAYEVLGDVDLRAEALVAGLLAEGTSLSDVCGAMAEAGVFDRIRRAVTKAVRKAQRKTSKVLKTGRKSLTKLMKRFGMKPAKKVGPSCPKGQKMVFGVCREVGGKDSDVDDGTKPTAWYKRQAARHKAAMQAAGDEMSRTWKDADVRVPDAALRRSMAHRAKWQEMEKLASMKPGERVAYRAAQARGKDVPAARATTLPAPKAPVSDRATAVSGVRVKAGGGETRSTRPSRRVAA